MATPPAGAGDARLRPADPEFTDVSRSWDPVREIANARIMPGEYYVTVENEMITTVLGSCISACVRDPQTGIGGMNHFLLPGGDGSLAGPTDACLETRYGIAAMESLLNDLIKRGARKERLELKLFGGADVLNMALGNIGQRNIAWVREFMLAERLSIAAEDLGGRRPRKIHYFPQTGRVLVKRLRAVHNMAVFDREKRYECTLGQKAKPGAVELFD